MNALKAAVIVLLHYCNILWMRTLEAWEYNKFPEVTQPLYGRTEVQAQANHAPVYSSAACVMALTNLTSRMVNKP